MKSTLFLHFLAAIMLLITTHSKAQTEPIVNEDVVFEEIDGLVAVEAEHFYKQSKSDIRQWYIYSKGVWPKVGRDDDDPHCKGASNNAYIEIIPDTRVTHGDKLIPNENFSGEPGKLALVHYKVNINNPGRYYVWVRAYSTGSEDNGIHVGLNGEWPESGQKMQWCTNKQSWHWESKQRTEKVHCGVDHLIYLDIKEKGEHEIVFSMREDGFEMDKFILTNDINYVPEAGVGPKVVAKSGTLPNAFPVVDEDMMVKRPVTMAAAQSTSDVAIFKAVDFPIEGTQFYVDKNWLAVNPNQAKEAIVTKTFKGFDRTIDVVFLGVGENDGSSEYTLSINDKLIGTYKPPLSLNSFEEASKYCQVWENVTLNRGDKITVKAKVGSINGEFSRARWSGIAFVPLGQSAKVLKAIDRNATAANAGPLAYKGKKEPTNVKPDITGELKRWHKVTLTFDGPETSETAKVNPFMNYKFDVTFTHKESGQKFMLPGYFAADGDAGNTSAVKGNKWRVHFAPNKIGQWDYKVNFRKGNFVAVSDKEKTGQSGEYMDQSFGSFNIAETDKTGRDFRGKGMLQYVGERYLKFEGTGEYFLKVGSDAPENMLAYEEFDGTFHNDGHKDNLVKKWEAHEKHWNEGDPTWQDGKGKDIIGAVNYLASKGMNAYSFITMNIGGDDQNVFPYIDYDTYDRMDCSKLDQWEVLFEHSDKLGMFLHFKTLEVENQGLLDNGGVGANSKVYYRELIARFGHHLALNWNLCEESGDWVKNNRTAPQFKWQRLSMAGYFADHDPYKRHIVIHNGNPFHDLLGTCSPLTGPSVQTNRADFANVHGAVLKWINESKKAGKQWAVACDEPGDAQHSLLPDAENPEHNNARMNGLWGTFMAGGWGTEWYFGYKHAHSDLSCEDYASRDLFWDQGKIALDFFSDNNIPFWEMESHDEMVADKGDYGFAKPGEIYVFYLKKGTSKVDLSTASGKLKVMWFNPRTGGDLKKGKIKTVKAGAEVDLGQPPVADGKDWVAVVRL
ncbi:DUF5060 domain-containing protein [Labilibacter marinus]|uniref:DUF5060 domain-containing protein n=1 Tax=Labilibacter marinus TaxID=1477105 RepID=UPI0018EA2295|nr:DUF5060 domain-containing protein [Labilibacter marinus]